MSTTIRDGKKGPWELDDIDHAGVMISLPHHKVHVGGVGESRAEHIMAQTGLYMLQAINSGGATKAMGIGINFYEAKTLLAGEA